MQSRWAGCVLEYRSRRSPSHAQTYSSSCSALCARMRFERYLQEARGFSPREAALLAWVAVKSYAKHEGLSLSTAKTYVSRILQRTGATSLQALIIAIERERLGTWV